MCVVYIQKDGAALLIGAWYSEKQQNKSVVEWKAFVDTVRIKSADLKNNFFVLDFCGLPCFLDVGKGRRLPYVA